MFARFAKRPDRLLAGALLAYAISGAVLWLPILPSVMKYWDFIFRVHSFFVFCAIGLLLLALWSFWRDAGPRKQPVLFGSAFACGVLTAATYLLCKLYPFVSRFLWQYIHFGSTASHLRLVQQVSWYCGVLLTLAFVLRGGLQRRFRAGFVAAMILLTATWCAAHVLDQMTRPESLDELLRRHRPATAATTQDLNEILSSATPPPGVMNALLAVSIAEPLLVFLLSWATAFGRPRIDVVSTPPAAGP